MKNLLSILVVTFSINVIAQDPQLFDATWYLHNVLIDGQEYIPPNNSEVQNIPLNFSSSNNEFITTVCNSFSGVLNFDGNVSFLIDQYSLTLIFCDLEDNTTFEGIYLSFFFDSGTLDPYVEPFPYAITVNGNDKILTIENVNGDQAIYGSTLLDNNTLNIKSVSVYPNPGNKILNIETGTNTLKKVAIYNILGKEVMNASISATTQQLNIELLHAGIYLMTVVTNDGQKQTLKFIKK